MVVCNESTSVTVTLSPSPAAVRMRLTRQRRRDGMRVIPFEIRDEEIEVLLARRLLDPVSRNDRSAIARALGALLDAVPPEQWPAGRLS